MIFRTKYSDHVVVSSSNNRPSLTEQSHKSACDINRLVARYQLTGVLGDPTSYNPLSYGDFTEVGDFQAQANAMAKVRQDFERLPAEKRAIFANDPGKFIDAFLDPNSDLLIKAGLISAPAPSVATPDNPVQVQPSQEQQSAVAEATGTVTT